MQVRTHFPDGRHELTSSHFRNKLSQLLQGRKQFRASVIVAHIRSFTFGELARIRRYRPTTITGTVSPGASFAIRVARVTPSVTSNTPSGSSRTNRGGISSFDEPNRRICCWSFQRSAPPTRLGGSRNSPGSTARIGSFFQTQYFPQPMASSGIAQAPAYRRASTDGRRGFPPIRVARMTPSVTSSTPSGSSNTKRGGIPSFDEPNRRICCCNFHGSATPSRLGGNRSSLGSTSRIGSFIQTRYYPQPTASSGIGQAPACRCPCRRESTDGRRGFPPIRLGGPNPQHDAPSARSDRGRKN